MDARTGRVMWHYYRESTGEEPVTANKGFGMYGNWLYFMTRDNFLVSLDAITGKQRWIIARLRSETILFFHDGSDRHRQSRHYRHGRRFARSSPDFCKARDPETGEIQWTHYNTPRAGEPGIETWPNDYASTHGGGGAWVQGAYDPELNLYYYGTANPNPGVRSAEPQRRGSLHILDYRHQSRYGENGVVFPGLAARHARLGCGMRYGPD